MSDTPDNPVNSLEAEKETKNINRDHHSTADRSEEVVDIWDLVAMIWTNRMYIVIFVIVLTVIGLFHVTYGPADQYVSNAVLLQETAGGGSNTQRLLQQFGGVFGFSSSGNGEAGRISAELYPFIISSAAFQYEIIYEEIDFSNFEEPLTPHEYFNEYYEKPIRDSVYELTSKYTIYLPYTFFDFVQSISFTEKQKDSVEVVEYDDRVLNLSGDEQSAMGELTERITLTIEGNLITVSTELPDPEAAAMLNVLVIEKIQEYVTEYQVEKARNNLEFIQRQYERAKEQYEEAQNELATFLDQNLNISSNVARVEEERLQNQTNMTYNIYNSVALELEQAELRLQEETPVFSVLQKSSLPTTSTGGSYQLIVVFSIVGAIIGLMYIFGVEIFRKMVSEVKSKTQ
ncbi:MAG: hypothetical protein RI575_18560 [Balneolaceae bacterium]|nr:hypothetical protein [Balneolaceae bacterium]